MAFSSARLFCAAALSLTASISHNLLNISKLLCWQACVRARLFFAAALFLTASISHNLLNISKLPPYLHAFIRARLFCAAALSLTAPIPHNLLNISKLLCLHASIRCLIIICYIIISNCINFP